MENIRPLHNKGAIVGVLSEKKFEEKDVEVKLGDGKTVKTKAMSGEIVLSTQNGDFKLRLYANAITKKGEENRQFKSLQTIDTNYVSKVNVAKNPELVADVVKAVTQLNCNDYVPEGTNEVRTSTQLKCNFVERTSADTELTTEMDLEGVIRTIKPETKNEEETGRLLVEFITFGYNGDAQPIDLVVEEDLADVFQEEFEMGSTALLFLEAKMVHVGATNTGGAKFGRKAKVSSGYDVMELIVIGCSQEGAIEDENRAFDIETLKKAMNERTDKLETMVANSKNKPSGGKKGGMPKRPTPENLSSASGNSPIPF